MNSRLARRLVTLSAALAVAIGAITVAGAQATVDPRADAFQRFKELYKSGQYAEALPVAQEVLRLTEPLGEEHPDLPRALNNLGRVQLRLGDLAGAEATFRRSLELAETNRGVASPQLIGPLTGLGAVHAAQNLHGRAAEELQRALAVSRRVDGLFNLGQLEIIEILITSLQAGGDYAGVERERLYALEVVQHQYGAKDPRTLPMLRRLADWYESSQQYAQQRAVSREAIGIAREQAGGRNESMVLALISLARSHRLQYAFDPASMVDDSNVAVMPDGRVDNRSNSAALMGAPSDFATQIRLEREGEQALLAALQTLRSTPSAPKALEARVLIELGDWYMTARKPELAIPRYQQAWPLLPASVVRDGGNPLLAPRQLLYRPPQGSNLNRDRPREQVIERSVECSLTVKADGSVADLKQVASDVESSSRETRTRRALDDAIYSPRFEDGKPVDTPDVRFRQTYYDVKPPPAPSKAPDKKGR